MKTDGNRWENPSFVFVSILFNDNGIGLGKAMIENRIGISEHMKMTYKRRDEN